MTHRSARSALLGLVVLPLVIGCVVEDDLGDRPDDQADGGPDGTGSGGGSSGGGSSDDMADDTGSDAAGDDNAPVFAAPLAAGAVLDLSMADCLDVRIVVEDPDDTRVEISASGSPDGATLTQDMDLEATWDWCPTAAQVEQEQHSVTFAADDGDHAPVLKEFLVELRP